MNDEPSNAVAGPSNPRSSSPSSSKPQLFLRPPGPPQTHPVYLSSTQDLLARFSLIPAYDKYVRPFAAPAETGLDQVGPVLPIPGVNGVADKGKGREIGDTHASAGTADGGDGGDGDDDDGAGGKGERKQKNNYKHLIKGVPGKHSLKKDEYLSTMMQVPPKQRMQITPFDLRTQREAFTVSLEGLKGWNPGVLVLPSAQAREDRRKRKELKRLAKLQHIQAQAQATTGTSIAHPQPVKAPMPTSTHSASSLGRPHPTAVPANVGTPRPRSTVPRPSSGSAGSATQRPGSAVPRPGSAISKQTSATAVPRPASTVPRPGSAVPRPGSAKPALAPVPVPTARAGTPLKTGPGTPLRSAGTATPTSAVPHQSNHPHLHVAVEQEKRGLKREREDVGILGVGVNGNGNGNGGLSSISTNPPKAIINAKAGTIGARPRPIKKQRMDIQGQARDVTVTQQPTPQGV